MGCALRQRRVRRAIPPAAHALLAVELRPEAMGLGVDRLRRVEALPERLLARRHARGVASRAALEAVELGDEADDVAELGQLRREDVIDTGRTGLAAERADALGEEARVGRLALGDDEVSGAEALVGLVLGPRRVELRAPRLERSEDVQPFADRRPFVHGTVM